MDRVLVVLFAGIVACSALPALSARPLAAADPDEATPTASSTPATPSAEETLPAEDTPTPTPTMTTTPTPKPVCLALVLRQIRALADGGFETGRFAPSWVASGTLGRQIVSGGLPRTGRYAALLGDPRYDGAGRCPVGKAAISQTIDVPSTGHPSLHVWYRIWSYDTIDWDYFAITLASASGQRETVHRDGCTQWTGTQWNSGWREAVVALDNYRGTALTIELANSMTNGDGWYNTWTYVDDVAVVTAP